MSDIREQRLLVCHTVALAALLTPIANGVLRAIRKSKTGNILNRANCGGGNDGMMGHYGGH